MTPREEAETRLGVLSALSQVLGDPARLVTLLAGARDEDEAAHLLAQDYGFTRLQADAVLAAQFLRVTRASRARVDDELEAVRSAMAVPWDPPIEARAVVHSPRLVLVELEGVQHRVAGEDPDDCFVRLVELVREQAARPRRRNVAVMVDGGGAPGRLIVDPVGSARFDPDEDLPDEA